MTLNIGITYLDDSFINSSKSSEDYSYTANAVCGFYFPDAEIRKLDIPKVVFCPC